MKYLGMTNKSLVGLKSPTNNVQRYQSAIEVNKSGSGNKESTHFSGEYEVILTTHVEGLPHSWIEEVSTETCCRQVKCAALGKLCAALGIALNRINSATKTCGHTTNSCRLDTTHHHSAAAADTADTVVVEVGTADNTDHTVVEHNQVGCRLPAVEHYKPQLCAQTLT
ncbi:hypothetical protein Tco_0879426, partial [Tanacetum coccineum]